MATPALRRALALALLAALAAVASAGCRDQPRGRRSRSRSSATTPRDRGPGAGTAVAIRSGPAQQRRAGPGALRRAPATSSPGLAERWNVSDDGLSYIFRLASAEWPDGSQDHRAPGRPDPEARRSRPTATIRSRTRSARSSEIVAMTDRVIEIRLIAPRPNLLPLLAQPEFAMSAQRPWHGPVPYRRRPRPGGELRLAQRVVAPDGEEDRREEVLVATVLRRSKPCAPSPPATSDLVLGGTFADLPFARRGQAAAQQRCGSTRRRACSDWSRRRAAARSTELERPALAEPGDRPRCADRRARRAGPGRPRDGARSRASTAFRRRSRRMVGGPGRRAPAGSSSPQPTACSATASGRSFASPCPTDPAPTGCFDRLAADWGALGFKVERAASRARRPTSS